MHIDIPDDLNRRLEQFAKDRGQDVDVLVREAIEQRLAMEEQLAKNLEGWITEELRAAIQEGLDSGPPTPLDMEMIKKQARQEQSQSRLS